LVRPYEECSCALQVKPDGTYVRKMSDRLMYFSMLELRVLLPKLRAIDTLAKASTIAVRYSTVRKQGTIKPEYEHVLFSV